MNTKEIRTFQQVVYDYYAKNRRVFPWRKTRDPYRIVVSEIMLQQTQAGQRTVKKYQAFIKKFPTIRVLAKASLSDVYALWQGLGYNRRAKALRDLAGEVCEKYQGTIPSDEKPLLDLPGIGPYSASAILAFAFNRPIVMIETNIRNVYIHHFFPTKKTVSDDELIPYIKATLDTKNPRLWYSALMDYGAGLKKEFGNANRKSAHYVRQKTFKGSSRELRGKLLQALHKKKQGTASGLAKLLKQPLEPVKRELYRLEKEGMLKKKGRYFLFA